MRKTLKWRLLLALLLLLVSVVLLLWTNLPEAVIRQILPLQPIFLPSSMPGWWGIYA